MISFSRRCASENGSTKFLMAWVTPFQGCTDVLFVQSNHMCSALTVFVLHLDLIALVAESGFTNQHPIIHMYCMKSPLPLTAMSSASLSTGNRVLGLQCPIPVQ